ncbi:MAG: hypothetical protein WCA15_11975 [Candidatus Acidiferrales bacterium]
MVRRFLLLGLLAIIAGSAASSALRTPAAGQEPCATADHREWVADALKKMETIKPGMTRTELLTVFTTEGGTSTPMHRTFVSRDCPYFKVDVTFKAASGTNGADKDKGEEADSEEASRDVIVEISRPYLDFSIVD